jgi:hypothetical protein
MPRLISFSITTEQIRSRTKTVTRRAGWLSLKAGEELRAVEKAQGLKKGEHVTDLARIRVTNVRLEPLRNIDRVDVAREGLADHPEINGDPKLFVKFFCKAHSGCTPDTIVTRIEFEYL